MVVTILSKGIRHNIKSTFEVLLLNYVTTIQKKFWEILYVIAAPRLKSVEGEENIKENFLR